MQKTQTPALVIDEGAIPLPEDFKWGKEYVALRMWKELRDDGEYLFAACLRKFGPNDFGDKSEDHIYIGREIEWIGKRITDVNPRSKTFSKRVNQKSETVTERVFNEDENEWQEIEIPINATKTYNYLHKADNEEFIKQYKTLVGPTPRSGKTHFTFIWAYGSEMREIKNPKEFFAHSVEELSKWEDEQAQTEAFKKKTAPQIETKKTKSKE